jgi:hypothetical protein
LTAFDSQARMKRAVGARPYNCAKASSARARASE